jgi:hypothetical protein
MARWRRQIRTTLVVAATVTAVAVTAALAGDCTTGSAAADRELAAELLIARGDVVRLANATLSPPNRQGLNERVAGALGLLPWLLRQACDGAAAERLRAWQGRSLGAAADRRALIADLAAVIAAHPLDRDPFLKLPPPGRSLQEARDIHETYCAGCHDGAGDGAPDLALPPRDLFAMAKHGPEDEFLARLINGVKGDAAILYANPLSDAQVSALLRIYEERR